MPAAPPHEQQYALMARALGGSVFEGTNTVTSVALLARMHAIRVAGVGRSAAVLLCTRGTHEFALKLQPLFHEAHHHTDGRLDERDQDNIPFRELYTALLLAKIAEYETMVLGRAFSEMTLHTVRTVRWGAARMTPSRVIADLPRVMAGDQRARVQMLAEDRTWQFIAMERVCGGDDVQLPGYLITLHRADPSGVAVERFMRCMLAQLYAQLLVLARLQSIRHNDLHPSNISWVVCPTAHRVYYALPDGVRLVVPLADTAPLGLMAGTPCAQGYLLFKLGDWGMSSARTGFIDATGHEGRLEYGPTVMEGGEYEDGVFYERFDFSHLLFALKTRVRHLTKDTDEHVAFGSALATLETRLAARRIENTVRSEMRGITDVLEAVQLPAAVVDRRVVDPRLTPWAQTSQATTDLFVDPHGGGTLFAPYRRAWTDADLTADAAVAIPMRYAPIALPPSDEHELRRMQTDAMSVSTRPIDDARRAYRAVFAAKSV